MGDTKFRQTGRRTAKGPFRADLKAQRRAQAEARNGIWAEIPLKAQLAELTLRGGSLRQTARVSKRYEASLLKQTPKAKEKK